MMKHFCIMCIQCHKNAAVSRAKMQQASVAKGRNAL